MRVLGAVLAGGRSLRFGSDKALAMVEGRSLIEHAIHILGRQTEGLAVCGREVRGVLSLADEPVAGLGPLGGLNAALRHARRQAFDAVLCVPVDVFPLPPTLREKLQGHRPKILATQYSVGFWPVDHADALHLHLAQGHRSFRSWIEATEAASLPDRHLVLRNVNRPEDLYAREIRSHINHGKLIH